MHYIRVEINLFRCPITPKQKRLVATPLICFLVFQVKRKTVMTIPKVDKPLRIRENDESVLFNMEYAF